MNTKNGNAVTGLKSMLIVLTFIAVTIGFSGPAYAAIPTAERNALIDLYTSTSVSGWTNSANWNGAAGTECSWYGVYCDAGGNHVTGIDLSSNNLVGSIPASIGNLPSLTQLWLRVNSLSGALPAELANLTNLQILNLSSNHLTGSIPTQLGSMTSLQQLSLGNNMLSGSTPTQLGSLSNLQTLDLQSNQLTGSIPVEFGNLSALTDLFLFCNQLAGAVPAQLGNLTNLRILYLGNNQLSGAIPVEIGNLTQLQQLTLFSNQLTGAIPAQLGNLKNLQNLDLATNQLTGAIPAELGDLANLQRLVLSTNPLTGSIPAELGNLASLQELNLSMSNLSGGIPIEVWNLVNLGVLNLSYNQLSGAIPAQISNLTNLQYINFYSNQLSGSIPTQLGSLTHLWYLQLGLNQLSGAIPAQLGNLTNLQQLHLYNNQLSGPIPTEVGILTNLQHLYLSGNKLTGPIPAQLMDLVNLQAGANDFRWNALFTTDAALKTFLDAKQGAGNDWVSTQTIAPSNLIVSSATTTSISLSWTAIPYIADTGGYEIYYSTASGGTYTLFEITTDKSATSSTVTGLLSGNTYYFAVRTKTDSHGNNPNTVYSEYTPEVSSQTTGPNIQISDSLPPQSDLMMPFGSVTLGNTSNQTVTLTNIGNRDLVIYTIASADPLASPFGMTADNCSGQTIAPAGTCTLTVRFAPMAAGSFSDSFDIPSNDPDMPTVTMSVAGIGAIPVPDIAVTDGIAPDNDLQMPFGNVTVGVSSPAKSVTISNTGTVDLVVSSIQLSGTDAKEFSMDVSGGSSPCTSATPTIAAGKNCTITVTFAPSSIGAKTATIAVASNDPDAATVNISLSGTGLSASTNNPPTTTTLVFPVNGQTGLGTTVEFRWKKTTDPDGDAVTYHLSYCTDQNFTNCTPVDVASTEGSRGMGHGSSQAGAYYAGFGGTGLLFIGLVFAGGVKEKKRLAVLLLIAVILTGGMLASCGGSGGGGGDSVTPTDEMTYAASGLTSGATYYWKVIADDGNGGKTESAVWSFSTK